MPVLAINAMLVDEDYAHPHVRGRKKWYTAKLKNNYYKVEPAAGVNASASDMVQWLKAQLGDYPNVLNDKVLSQQVANYTKTKERIKSDVFGEKI